jgi:adenylosuccinate synthase
VVSTAVAKSSSQFHVPTFFKELHDLESRLPDVRSRLFVSDRCHVNLDLHIAVDGLEELEVRRPKRPMGPSLKTAQLGQNKIGTTGRSAHEIASCLVQVI